MATAVIMPRLGQSVESCIITEWHKEVGDTVREGDTLFSYETDKAAFEEAAKLNGTLLARFFEADDDVPCLLNVAVIGEPGEDISAFAPDGGEAQPSIDEPKDEPAQQASSTREPDNRVNLTLKQAHIPATPTFASPRARMTAMRLGVEWQGLQPSGPDGRVIERDVLSALCGGSQPAAPSAVTEVGEALISAKQSDMAYEDVKLSGVRKTIARGMLKSLQSTAQLTNHASFDATAMLSLRTQLKAVGEGQGLPNITLNDIMLYACALALTRHPDLNAHYMDDKIRRYKSVHLGLAVDTPRGLLVPTLFNADTLSLPQIALASKQLAKAALSGRIDPDLLTGATFTISNLGTLGVEQFTPIINPPQTGILGVGCTVERVRTIAGRIETYPAMGLSLTYDHRVVDGAPAARFILELKTILENISACLIVKGV